MCLFAVRVSAVLSVLLGMILVFPAAPAVAGRGASNGQGDIYVEIRPDQVTGYHYYIETGSNRTCEYVHIEHSYQRVLGTLEWVKQTYLFPTYQQHGGIFFISLNFVEERDAQHHWFTGRCIASETGPVLWLSDVYLYTPSYGREGGWYEYPFFPPKPWWIF